MKKYKIVNRELELNPILCEYMLNSLMNQGFMPVEVRAGGRFYFEYEEKHKECRFFCSTAVSGLMYQNQLSDITNEVKRVFTAHEVINKGSRIRIFKLDKYSGKERSYINNIAKQHGLECFDETEYLKVVALKRNTLIYKANVAVTLLMAALSLLFSISSVFTHWLVAVIGLLPLFATIAGIVAIRSLKSELI